MPFCASPNHQSRGADNSGGFFAPFFLPLTGAILLLLAACSPAAVADPFDDSGELIALSGGDAGPQAACHTCHGLDGGGDGALVPRIAALNTGYLVRQLDFFADGQRSHPQMSWLSAKLASRERAAVSAYYAQMPMPDAGPLDLRVMRVLSDGQCRWQDAAIIYHAGVRERGLQSCASCHGEDGRGVGEGNPSLLGQSSAYLAEQLKNWRLGKRFGDPLGVMHDAASKLREEEISPLSDYISGGLARTGRPQSRAECP